MTALDRIDRGSHAFAQGTAVKLLPNLFASCNCVAMQLIEPMCGVIDANGLNSSRRLEKQDDRVFDDVAAPRREVNGKQGTEAEVETFLVANTHTPILKWTSAHVVR